ncbi:AAA family ATPase [Candidatus Poriferisodalis sp.]|uniref:AAA family ATPase n=1 Tax=Candidatus Poriferisodalis sp. TaxID=3101277 RepID=UPI003D0F7AA1
MSDDIFEEFIDLPDPTAQRRYHQLVGLDDVKQRLSAEGELLLFPDRLRKWSRRYHGPELRAVEAFVQRPPLMIFADDIGTGKTTLAETFGHEIASRHGRSVKVLRLSLRARGSGHVGEMTRLLGEAFDTVAERARHAGASCPIIMVIDEADAIAQNRADTQMHHEDRAGVNALIRGIDQVASERLHVVVVMCTNRLDAIDPAIVRRSAATFEFKRPVLAHREAILKSLFADGVPDADWGTLAALTGPSETRDYGYTASDLSQRLIPQVVLTAYPDQPITERMIAQAIAQIEPTKPFTGS